MQYPAPQPKVPLSRAIPASRNGSLRRVTGIRVEEITRSRYTGSEDGTISPPLLSSGINFIQGCVPICTDSVTFSTRYVSFQKSHFKNLFIIPDDSLLNEFQRLGLSSGGSIKYPICEDDSSLLGSFASDSIRGVSLGRPRFSPAFNLPCWYFGLQYFSAFPIQTPLDYLCQEAYKNAIYGS